MGADLVAVVIVVLLAICVTIYKCSFPKGFGDAKVYSE
jgi:hypothetical protein